MSNNAEKISGGSAATSASLPPLHRLFEENARRNGAATALIHAQRRVSYGELDKTADHVARALHERGIRTDMLVGVSMPRSPEMIAVVLGIVKAGGVVLPIDPSYPEERRKLMLSDSGARMVVGNDILAARDPERSVSPVLSQDHPDALLYAIFTSGSTGRPKAVGVPHRCLANLLAWQSHGRPAPRTLQFTSLSFDVSFQEIFGTLSYGGELCLIEQDQQRDANQLLQVLERSRIERLFLPFVALDALAQAAGPRRLSDLREIITAGEQLRITPAVARFFAANPQCSLENQYGPSETHVVTSHRLAGDPTGWPTLPPIGHPVRNTRVYVMSEALKLVDGSDGELYLAGDGVARGYVGRPDLTAERFLPDPHGPAGSRMYRTGDVGRWVGTEIEFIGRNDQQVKVRGYRIELGEIEVAISALPGVRQCAVVAVRNGPGTTLLVAHVVPAELEPGAVREALSTRMPEYMVPAVVMAHAALPLTPSGKIDRKALPAPDFSRIRPEYEAPCTPMEAALAALWSEILGVERVGRRDDFFALGGHSLLALTLVARMRERGLHMHVAMVFSNHTLEAMAAAAGAGTSGGANGKPTVAGRPEPRPTRITPDDVPLASLTQEQIDAIVRSVPGGVSNIREIYPLTPSQEGILFHNLIAKRGDPHLRGYLLAFGDRSRLDAYIKALQAAIDRHDALRTSVHWDDLPTPMQVVWSRATLKVEEVTLEPGGADAAEQLWTRFDPRIVQMDLRIAPLVSLVIGFDPEQSRWLALELIHHLICDNTTFELLRNEIEAHLSGNVERLLRPASPRELVLRTRAAVSAEEQKTFFTSMLRDVEQCTAPYGLIGQPDDEVHLVDAKRSLNAALLQRLRARARTIGVTPAALHHLAFAMVLARTSGRDDVVFGTVLFGRMEIAAGAERAFGSFINTLPIRIETTKGTVEDAVRQIHSRLGDLSRHESASLTFAQQCSGVSPPAPLFSALLNCRHVNRAAPKEPSAWEGIQLIRTFERTNYPFSIDIDDMGEMGVEISAQITSPGNPSSAVEMMEHTLAQLVNALEVSPEMPLSRIDVLSAAQQRGVLEFSGRPFAGQMVCAHDLVAHWAQTAPDSVALVGGGREWTYGELHVRAGAVARNLQALGVKRGDLVALSATRQPETLIGLLGILMAGAAYVPIDPTLPERRREHMLDNCGAAVGAGYADLEELLPHVLRLDQPIDECAPATTLPATIPADSMVVLYTSGTTGEPKGVVLPHRGLVTYAKTMCAELGLSAADRILQFASLSFDASLEEILGAWSAGAALVLRDETMLDPLKLFEACSRVGVSVLDLPTAYLPLAVEAAESHGWPGSLRWVIIGGERIERPIIERFARTNAPPRLWSTYGPTEASISVTACELTTVTTHDTIRSHAPLGNPIEGADVYILDQRLKPCPIGVAGEIYIGGLPLADGYLDDAGRTADRFLPSPFASGARIYRTGDVGVWRPQGTLDFLGRVDSQIKIRGYRIEPEAIAAVLAAHPAVAEATVIARRNDRGEPSLAAYIRPGAEKPDPAAIRKFASERLPPYFVPAAFVVVDRWPLTAHGKLDKAALPAPDFSQFRSEYIAPSTPVEATLASIWAELLTVKRIGIHDDFFGLGGNSLLATKVISRIRRELGVELNVRAIFERPNVSLLANTIVELLARDHEAAAAALLAELETGDGTPS